MTSGGNLHSLVACLHTQRHGKPRINLSFVVRPVLWTMPNDGIQGYKWGAYVVLDDVHP